MSIYLEFCGRFIYKNKFSYNIIENVIDTITCYGKSYFVDK